LHSSGVGNSLITMISKKTMQNSLKQALETKLQVR
jgi:hypothetical protein